MKKIIFIAAVALMSIALVNKSFTQGLYVGIDAGYALKMASGSKYSFDNVIRSETVSYGKGFDAGIQIGYMFNKNIGVDLGLSYLIGAKIESNVYGSAYSNETDAKSRMFRIAPSVVVKAGFEKIDPYAKLGVILGFGSIENDSKNTSETSFGTTLESVRVEKDKGGMAFGILGAMGVDYNFSEKLAVFAELNVESMSYAPAKGELTEWTDNGVDKMEFAQTYQKEFEYVDELPSDYDASQTPDEPSKQIIRKFPFSSIGLNVGVKIKL